MPKRKALDDLVPAINDHRVVCIVWHDAASEDAWTRKDDAGGIAVCCTFGFVINESKDAIIVSHTIAPTDGGADTCCSIAIPKGCIVDAYELKEVIPNLTRVRPRRARK
jgi:hypothetical protein